MGRLRISYRGFYDVPRTFVAEWKGRLFYFDGHFDERLDDYPDHFRVYELPSTLSEQVETLSWEGLAETGRYVGQVPVKEVSFARRRIQEITGFHSPGVSSIDDAIFRTLGLE